MNMEPGHSKKQTLSTVSLLKEMLPFLRKEGWEPPPGPQRSRACVRFLIGPHAFMQFNEAVTVDLACSF